MCFLSISSMPCLCLKKHDLRQIACNNFPYACKRLPRKGKLIVKHFLCVLCTFTSYRLPFAMLRNLRPRWRNRTREISEKAVNYNLRGFRLKNSRFIKENSHRFAAGSMTQRSPVNSSASHNFWFRLHAIYVNI